MANPSHYYRPTKLDDAAKLAKLTDSVALAGGALTLKGMLLPYEHVIDLQDIAELQIVETQNDVLSIGGAVTLQHIVNLSDIPVAVKRSLTRAIPLNIRNGSTVGESLVASNLPIEWITALCALGATVQHMVDETLQEESLEEFVTQAASSNYLGFVTQLFIPVMPHRSVLGTAFVARTPADNPIVNAAVFLAMQAGSAVQSAYGVVAGASEKPVLGIELDHMTDNRFDEDLIAHAIKPIAPLVDPVADYKGSVEYRKEMAAVCVKRALMDCLEQL